MKQEPNIPTASEKNSAIAKYALVWLISLIHTSWYILYVHSTHTELKYNKFNWGFVFSIFFFFVQVPATFISGALYETSRKKFSQPPSINIISQCLLVSQFLCFIFTLLIFLELIHL